MLKIINKEIEAITFNSVKEAVKTLRLDRRHKWADLNGELYYPHTYSYPCSGCSCDCSDGHGCSHGNSGCHECGYKGRSRRSIPIFEIRNGEPVKILKPSEGENHE